MKLIRYLGTMIFVNVLLIGIFGVISPKICGIICLLIILIMVISERQYYNKYRRPWIDILTMFYFLKDLKTERNKLYLTGGNKTKLDTNASFMRKYGKRILEDGEKVVSNLKIPIVRRNEVKKIMEDVQQMLEKEKL